MYCNTLNIIDGSGNCPQSAQVYWNSGNARVSAGIDNLVVLLSPGRTAS